MKKNSLTVIYGTHGSQMAYTIMESAGIEKKVSACMNIAIKPNLVVAKPSQSGATTCPGVIEGIIRFLKDCGVSRIKIMEGSWIGAGTRSAFKSCGYEDLSHKYDVPLVDLKKDPVESLSSNGLKMKVCKSPLEADFLINVPVLKAHCQTNMTCALKNMKGCIPDSEKRRFHTLGLHKPIAVLNTLLKTNLVIVDGIQGDLTFEEGGNPVSMNRLILGTDPVLVDSYAAQLLGYSPEDIDYIALSEKMGVGSSKIEDDTVMELNRDDTCAVPSQNTGSKVKNLSRYTIEDQACSACYGNLIHALARLEEKGLIACLDGRVHIGQGFKGKHGHGTGIGNCTSGFSHNIPGCPPKTCDIVKHLLQKL